MLRDYIKEQFKLQSTPRGQPRRRCITAIIARIISNAIACPPPRFTDSIKTFFQPPVGVMIPNGHFFLPFFLDPGDVTPGASAAFFERARSSRRCAFSLSGSISSAAWALAAAYIQ